MKAGLRLGTALLAGLALMPLAQARPERNAFLNKAAPNLRSIIRQVKFDPQVLSRYQRHFGLSKWELVAYFETFRLAKLKKSASYIVFNCRESDGAIRSRVFHLKKGTLVYVDRFDQPVLKFSCGNPMSRGPSRMLVADIVNPAPLSPPVERLPEDETIPSDPVVPTEIMVAEELAVPPLPPTTPVTPPTPPVPTEPTIVKPNVEGPPAWIIPLISGAIIFSKDDGHHRPPAVPEPSTVIVALVGIGMYSRLRKRPRGEPTSLPAMPRLRP